MVHGVHSVDRGGAPGADRGCMQVQGANQVVRVVVSGPSHLHHTGHCVGKQAKAGLCVVEESGDFGMKGGAVPRNISALSREVEEESGTQERDHLHTGYTPHHTSGSELGG